MSVERSPSFSFYPKDWLSDVKVRTMSPEVRAIYLDLLCFCWTEESLPDDPQALAQVLGVSPRLFGKWWPSLRGCFEEQDGRLRHPQLDQERANQAAWRTTRAAAGRKGAARRWHSHGPAMAKPPPDDGSAMAEPSPDDGTAIDVPCPEDGTAIGLSSPENGTAIDLPMLGDGIAVRSSLFACSARGARNSDPAVRSGYHAVSRSVRAFLRRHPHRLTEDPPDWVELKEGVKDQCRADGVTWTHSVELARAIDAELAKFRKGVGVLAREVNATQSGTSSAHTGRSVGRKPTDGGDKE